ncbi:MAG: amidase [Aureliella sp.]
MTSEKESVRAASACPLRVSSRICQEPAHLVLSASQVEIEEYKMKSEQSDTETVRTGFANNSRRTFLSVLAATGIGTHAFQRALAVQAEQAAAITPEMIASAEWISGIELDDDERESVARSLSRHWRRAEQLRRVPVDADTVPAFVFRPDFFYQQADAKSEEANPQTPEVGTTATAKVQVVAPLPKLARGLSDEDLAFASIPQQAAMLAKGKISSRELTSLYLKRLERFDPLLKCVVTMLEEHALKQAEESDKRRTQNSTRGILDGIPWVAKDLIALPPWKTTWGAEPFKDQVREETATVAKQLESSGAVLLAKVTLGAMAWGDKWFGGLTRNPWNPDQGSSGSSAGSASAVAAGLASFALGSETLGSIVSPTTRCRTSGLRPTFGRVSRAGCMPLAWSMDKIGPIARHAGDLALVLGQLLGQDGKDPTLVERDFQWPGNTKIAGLRIGVTGDRLNATEQAALEFLKSEGAELVDIDLASEIPVGAMSFILGVEASTVFDDAFHESPDANYGNWPQTFRESQYMPAIHYVRANRLRSELIRETQAKLSGIDCMLGANDLLLTNLTGHPSIVVACGGEQVNERSMPGVVKLTAAAYRESTLVDVGQAIQAALPPTPDRPPLEPLLKEMQQKAEAAAEEDAKDAD